MSDLNTTILTDIRATLAEMGRDIADMGADLGDVRVLLQSHNAWLRDHEISLTRVEGHPPRRRPTGPRGRR